MRILGLSAFHRDSAAALVIDGVPVAAAQEERYSRKCQDSAFPARASRFCLSQAGIEARDLDYVVFYEKPLRKFERTLATQMQAFPRSARTFARSMFLWLGDRMWVKSRIADELGVDLERIRFVEHQLSHAASTYHPSPFDEAAILVADDAGEWATTTLAHGKGTQLETLAEIHFPHSLGMLASAITQFLGFAPGSEEHLVEALALHGKPRFEEQLAGLVPESDGCFTLQQEPFRFSFDNELLFESGLEELLGPARQPGAPLRLSGSDTRDVDVATSLQRVLEKRVLSLAQELHKRTGARNLCFAGCLARNRTLNGRLLIEGPFDALFVPPAPDEAGAALGAALYLHHLEQPEAPRWRWRSGDLGEAIDVRAEQGARELGAESAAFLAERLSAGECVAWVRGQQEFGSHSLGHRSILRDCRGERARSELLDTVRHTEEYRQCRVAVRSENAAEYFELPQGAQDALRFSALRLPATDALRAAAPSAVAADGSAWPQLIDEDADQEFHALLGDVAAKTGATLLLHADFNLRGSPIVRNEADAVEAFRRSSLGCLVVGSRVYEQT